MVGVRGGIGGGGGGGGVVIGVPQWGMAGEMVRGNGARHGVAGRGATIAVRANLPYGRPIAGHHDARTTRYIVHVVVILDKRHATSHKHVRLDNHNHTCHNGASIKQPGSTNVARSKLSNQQVIEIRRRAREGVTAREMAQELLVSAETIRRVVRMETHLLVEVGQELEAVFKG